MAVIRNGGREEVYQVMAVVRLRQRIFFCIWIYIKITVKVRSFRKERKEMVF